MEIGLVTGRNSGKDIFNAKWITAIICDAGNRMYFVEIKHILGDYFLAEIEKEIYCFRLKGERIMTFRSTAAKSFRAIIYNTTHYMPISGGDQKLLEDVLVKNSLPKVTNRLYGILKLFGSREKTDDKDPSHSLKALVDEISDPKVSEEYKDEVASLKNYLDHLNVDQIITPVKKVVEYLDGEFLATDPKYFGTVMTTHLSLEMEHKKITNSPINAKKPWLKIIVLIMLVVMLVVVVYFAYSSGTFSHLLPTFGSVNTTGQPTDEAGLLQKYPTPEAMKAAIARGELKYDALPPDVQKMVDQVKTPVAAPIPSYQH